MKALEILRNNNIFDESYVSENNLQNKISEAIEELEALEARSCESCKYNTYRDEFSHNCTHSSIMDYNEGYWLEFDFCCNKWESKC